jgi:predicted flap endonuclease-1-like 5' DNA nuclease
MNSLGWLVFIGVVILTFIVAWAILTKRPSQEQLDGLGHGDHEHHEVETEETDHSTEIEQEEARVEPIQETTFSTDVDTLEKLEPATETSDDLVVIEGIGPKIAGILGEAGITTYVQLSNTDVDTLKKILADARLQMTDPTTWPEQARLAGMEDKTALNEFQKRLRGGRN